jgi:serine/threonine protein kinase
LSLKVATIAKSVRVCVLDCGRKADCKVRSPETGEVRLLCRTCYDELLAASASGDPSALVNIFLMKVGASPLRKSGSLPVAAAAASTATASSSSSSSSIASPQQTSPQLARAPPVAAAQRSGSFGPSTMVVPQGAVGALSTNVHTDAEARRHDPRLGSNLVASHFYPHMSVAEARHWVVRQLKRSEAASAAEFVVHGLGEADSAMLVTYTFVGAGAVTTVRILSPPNELLLVEGVSGEFESLHTYLASIGVVTDSAASVPWVPPLAALRREPPLVALLALYSQPSKHAANVLRTQRTVKCFLTARPTERHTLAIVVRSGTTITKSLIVREGDRYYFRPGDGIYADSIVELLRIAQCIDEKEFPRVRREPLRTLKVESPRSVAAPSAPASGGSGGSSGKLYGSISEALQHNAHDAPPPSGDVLMCTVRLAKIAELDERHRDVDGFCLMKMPWYHGAIASDTATALLDGAPAGTFLMRTSIKRAEHAWALSVVQTKANSTQLEVAHVRVHNSNGRAVRVDGYPSTFPTARYMVSHIGVLVHAMSRRTDAAVRAQTPLRVTKPPIGKGATGVVFKARIELPELDGGGVTVALKQLRSELEGDADEQASMAREVDTMLLIPPHPNIVALLGIVMQAPVGIVTEFLAVGSLDALLYKQKRRFALPDQRRLASEIACGVAFLHENNIVHRDLATRNILLSEDLTAKVSDFGMSRMLGDAKYNYSQIDSGPIRWMAPEQLKRKQGVNKSVYSPATDAFSFAMTLVELSTNQLPWPQLTNVEAAIAVCQAERPELDTSLVEPTVLRVIETCWAHEPADRLTLSKAHSVLTGRSDIGDEEQDNDDDGGGGADPMPLSAAPEPLDDDDAEPYDAPPPHLSRGSRHEPPPPPAESPPPSPPPPPQHK